MGQNFGCNCMDRKDDSKKKGNTLPRQYNFQREFQIDGSLEADKGLIWLMNQQRGQTQYQQATYVLKQPVIDLNSSYITESSKSFMINGERVNVHKDSHCSFDDTQVLSCNNPNKFRIIQVSNSEVLNYLKKCNKEVIYFSNEQMQTKKQRKITRPFCIDLQKHQFLVLIIQNLFLISQIKSQYLKRVNFLCLYEQFYNFQVNQQILNFLFYYKIKPNLIPTCISPHQQDKDECLITLQASDWVFRKQILTSPYQKSLGNFDYFQKTFNINTNSLTQAYQQIYSYFKKEVQENWSYMGYNISEKIFGSIDINIYFQVRPIFNSSNSNLSTNRSNSSSQSSQNLFDFETIVQLEQKNIEYIINSNIREGKVFKGCISLLYNKDQSDDWHILIFEKQDNTPNQVVITTVDQKVYTQNNYEISMKVQAICELDSLCFNGMITDLRQHNIQIIFSKDLDQYFY
ncbi:hypothetical protein TTHERM_00143730 (macronuclear) [Tetrahymena thermophila SB210]|uniref:Uncharacterized protein n=1 Tax=Tetrahymena thermophila (strain SB210) TaxID=312017 RepID=I7MI45_TETTS|nr:hypothetical protein TTHERM_00143730 [Tetrahymena thermophila SB210]EAR90867.2 hypothetical protein TTHERM_00143730 [Tetrahymena thermophila SB210]|eukprot:XP_001011112.2 hypothetical protein TTHERM_00143730 [Tetrahymena thermophila SB210]